MVVGKGSSTRPPTFAGDIVRPLRLPISYCGNVIWVLITKRRLMGPQAHWVEITCNLIKCLTCCYGDYDAVYLAEASILSPPRPRPVQTAFRRAEWGKFKGFIGLCSPMRLTESRRGAVVKGNRKCSGQTRKNKSEP